MTFGALALYGGACFLFYAHSIWLPMSAPMLAGAVSFAGNTAFRYLTVDRELSRTRGTLERYVSPQLVSYVMDNIDSIRFDGQKRKLTIFFSDVRSFTTLTEKSDPVRLLKQLNEYLEAMTDIIFKYDGIVDKFIGDGIMAHWGAFTPDRPNAALAARAALDMMEKLAELNEHWEVNGFPAARYRHRAEYGRGDLRQRGRGQEARLHGDRRRRESGGAPGKRQQGIQDPHHHQRIDPRRIGRRRGGCPARHSRGQGEDGRSDDLRIEVAYGAGRRGHSVAGGVFNICNNRYKSMAISARFRAITLALSAPFLLRSQDSNAGQTELIQALAGAHR